MGREPDLAQFLFRCQTYDSLKEQMGDEVDNAADQESYGFGFCDLRSLAAGELATLVGAMEAVISDTIDTGPNVFTPPSAFSDFLSSISHVKACLRTDSRIAEDSNNAAPGILRISSQATWMAPTWAYDHVIENTIADLKPLTEPSRLLAMLLEHRTSAQRYLCDLSQLDANEFARLSSVARWLSDHYGERIVSDLVAPEFHKLLSPHIVTFTHLILSNPRVGNNEEEA